MLNVLTKLSLGFFFYLQPNERPGESLLDLDFDAFQPDESVSPIPQVPVNPNGIKWGWEHLHGVLPFTVHCE